VAEGKPQVRRAGLASRFLSAVAALPPASLSPPPLRPASSRSPVAACLLRSGAPAPPAAAGLRKPPGCPRWGCPHQTNPTSNNTAAYCTYLPKHTAHCVAEGGGWAWLLGRAVSCCSVPAPKPGEVVGRSPPAAVPPRATGAPPARAPRPPAAWWRAARLWISTADKRCSRLRSWPAGEAKFSPPPETPAPPPDLSPASHPARCRTRLESNPGPVKEISHCTTAAIRGNLSANVRYCDRRNSCVEN